MYKRTDGKEYFYLVSGLMVPKYMIRETLVEDIEYLVDWVPKNVDKLKSLVVRNMKQFVFEMEQLYIMLCKIHAHWLELESARILRMAEIDEPALCQQLLAPFTTNLSTLAIDIQAAQRQGFEANYWQRDEIEKCKSIISSMQIISVLLRRVQFEKAVDFALSINEFKDSEEAITFMSYISKRNVTRALNLVDEVIAVNTKKINSIIDKATTTVTDDQKKIVVVDDMPEILAALDAMLNEHYKVFAFSDSKEVLEFIDTVHQPDAFLLDIDMPIMDGLTLAKNIRSRPQYENTPILFLTGNTSRETVVKSAMYGAKAFLIKPANKDILLSKLSSCV